MNSAQYRVKEHNVAKGMQLEYTLMPLATIEKLFLKEENPVDRVVQSIDNAIIDDCEYKMGVLLLTKQRFNDLYQRVKENAYFLNEQIKQKQMKNHFWRIYDKYLCKWVLFFNVFIW